MHKYIYICVQFVCTHFNKSKIHVYDVQCMCNAQRYTKQSHRYIRKYMYTKCKLLQNANYMPIHLYYYVYVNVHTQVYLVYINIQLHKMKHIYICRHAYVHTQTPYCTHTHTHTRIIGLPAHFCQTQCHIPDNLNKLSPYVTCCIQCPAIFVTVMSIYSSTSQS